MIASIYSCVAHVEVFFILLLKLSSFRVARLRWMGGRCICLSQQGVNFGHGLCRELLIASLDLALVSSMLRQCACLLCLGHWPAALGGFVSFVARQLVRVAISLLLANERLKIIE
jgi:hypothetical protein